MTTLTLAVLAARYRGRPASLLTHSLVVESGRALCPNVNPDSLTDAGNADAPPTCPVCLARDPRFSPES